MTNGKDCTGPYVGLVVMSIALLMSVCLNIFLYSLRRKDRQNRDVGVPLYHEYFHSDRFEDEELQNQDNPIYGNIFVDGGGESMPKLEYRAKEQITNKDTRQDEKSHPEDVSYASLDLLRTRLVKKSRNKKRYQEKQNQMHKVQTHPTTVAQMRCMEMRADYDGPLPSRTSSLTVSCSSIYLNSHQVALETEELQREEKRENETEWKSSHDWELMRLHDNVDQGLGQLNPSYDRGSPNQI